MSVVVFNHESFALKNNPLNDPFVRKVHVIEPDGWDRTTPLPCFWALAGYSGVSRGLLEHDPWREGLEERLTRLKREGKLGDVLVVLPDAFNFFGGVQYLSSSAVGDYEQYLFRELPSEIEKRWPILKHGVFGHSSGGYGAIVQAMRRPDLFSGVVCHAGDMGFELSLIPEIPKLMSALITHGSVESLVESFRSSLKKRENKWLDPIMVLALAAVYSPNPSAPLGIDLPFDLESGTLRWDVFERWLRLDPVNLIDTKEHQDALKKMQCVFIDCGTRDEFHSQFGARTFHQKLVKYGIRHEYEEFPDGHRSTSYRFDVSLPKLYHALTSPI